MNLNTMQSSYQRKINKLKEKCKFLHWKLQLANAQEEVQHNFQQYIRKKYPKIYWEAAKKVKFYVDKREKMKMEQ